MKFDKLKKVFAGLALSACVGTITTGVNVKATFTVEEVITKIQVIKLKNNINHVTKEDLIKFLIGVATVHEALINNPNLKPENHVALVKEYFDELIKESPEEEKNVVKFLFKTFCWSYKESFTTFLNKLHMCRNMSIYDDLRFWKQMAHKISKVSW